MRRKPKLKIAIADDNPAMRQELKEMLTAEGYSVKTFNDGYEVLAYLKNASPHILILDLVMPNKGGTDIISAIKSISPGTKIIIYTGFKEYEHLMDINFIDKFILKAGDPKELLKALKDMQ
ncbi:MAG: response regulator [Candidatus Omnitrophota bacterium]